MAISRRTCPPPHALRRPASSTLSCLPPRSPPRTSRSSRSCPSPRVPRRASSARLCPPTRAPSRTAKTSRSSPPPRVPRRPVRRATEAGEVEPVTARSAAEVGGDAPRARSYLPPRAPRKPARSNRCRSTRSAPRAAGHARRTPLATRALADHGVAAGVPRATAAVPHVLAPERGCGQSPPTSPPPSEVTGAPPGYATAGRAHLPRGRVGMASSEVSRESLPAGAPPG